MDAEVCDRAGLMASGVSRRALAASVRSGALVHVRRDRYARASTPADVVRAVRVGGRLSCLSLLQLLGVFVFANTDLHVHLTRGTSRLRAPEDRTTPLAERGRAGIRLHWMPLIRPDEAGLGRVSIVDALAHAVRCQQPRHAIATLDSALNLGLVNERDLAAIFRVLPARYAVLRGLVDGAAESGTETLVRLMARGWGCRVELQRQVDNVGRVDLLIDGWLVVECDSREFHSSWEQQVKDRDRDRELARQGYAVLRLTAADILYRPESVAAALHGLIQSRRS